MCQIFDTLKKSTSSKQIIPRTSPNGAYGIGDKISCRKIILASQLDANGEAAIKVEVKVFQLDRSGKKKYKRLPTGIRCKPAYWDKRNQVVKSKDFNSTNKNLKIERLFAKVNQYLLERKTRPYGNSSDVELQVLNDLFPNQTKSHKKTLVEYIDDYIIYRKGTGTPRGTLKEFTSLKNRLLAFETTQKKPTYFEDINFSFSDNFGFYLQNAVSKKDDLEVKKYQSGTIEKTFTILRTVLNHFNDRKEELNIQLSDKFKAKSFKKGTKSVNDAHPISRPEFEILKNHVFESESLEHTKRRFLFQCSTGLRYSDMFNISKRNIHGINTPNETIVYYPVKTVHKRDNEVEVPVNPISKKILESVNYDMSTLKISNQKYNQLLTKMFTELNSKHNNIFDKYTTHDGRDTFITYALESEVDVPTLLKMVGQSSYEVMKRYFKSSPERRIEMMSKIVEFK